MNFKKTSPLFSLYVSLGIAPGILPFTLLSAETAYTYQVEIPAQIQTNTSSKRTLSSIVLDRAVNQLAFIDLALEELSQAAANNTLAIKNTKDVQAFARQLRTLSIQARQGTLISLTPEHALLLLEFNQELLNALSNALASGLHELPTVDTDKFIHRSRAANEHSIDIAQANTLLTNNDTLLLQIPHNYKVIGSTSFNRFAKSTAKFLNNWHVLSASKRVLPYVGLGAYYTLITKNNNLPQWGFIQKIKNTIGNLPKSTTIHEVVNTTQPASTDNNLRVNPVDDGAGVNLNQPPQQPQRAPEQQRSIADRLEDISNEIRTASLLTIRDKTEPIPGTGLAAVFNKIGKLVTLETKPFYTIVPGVVFMPIIKRDAEDLGNWVAHQAKKTAAYLQGEKLKSDDLTKQSKITFDDIIGFDHIKQRLGAITNYFKHKTLFKRTGATVERGYLLVGSLDLGKQFAYAVAGEITKQFKAQDKTTRCGVYELHASALTDKKLTKILKDLEKEAPCIIILDELDWLGKQQVDPEVWADLVSAHAELAKKNMFIIATAQDTQTLDTALNHHERLGVTLELGQPTHEDRHTFFARELEKYTATLADFDLAYLANQTAHCSYTLISAVLQKALNIAHTTRTTLTQKHIEQSINELIHGIIASDSLTEAEKTILAAHYAGKAIAYQCLYADKSLVKVTLLPINNSKKLEQGGLITTLDHNALTMTRKQSEKECIVECAGIEAQRLLLGFVSRKLEQQVNKKVLALAKSYIFEGVNEHDLPKEAKQEFLAQAWDLMTSYNKRAQALVATHKERIRQIADKLITHQILSAEQL